jgi:preprotein translocase subunit SecG
MLQGLLLSLNILVCLALIAVVLMQRSEGGGFGGGGNPGSLMTARGAGDLLTRSTWILFSLFLVLSLALTLIGGHQHSTSQILNRLKNETINPDQTPPAHAPLAPPASPSTAPSPAQAPVGNGGFLAAPKPTLGIPTSAAPGSSTPPPAPPKS